VTISRKRDALETFPATGLFVTRNTAIDLGDNTIHYRLACPRLAEQVSVFENYSTVVEAVDPFDAISNVGYIRRIRALFIAAVEQIRE
jgi:hypothetical protein